MSELWMCTLAGCMKSHYRCILQFL